MTDSRYTTPSYLLGPCHWCGSTTSVRTYSREGAIECVYSGRCLSRQAAAEQAAEQAIEQAQQQLQEQREAEYTTRQATYRQSLEEGTTVERTTTCQLATPSRTGRDGRPYTTCGVRANPAGYCSECGTRVATRTGDDTWVAACGAPLLEELELDGGATQRQVTATCDRPVSHEGEHLAAVLGHTGERTGELVEWPATLAELLEGGATLQFVEGEEPQESVREYNRRMHEEQATREQATRWAVEVLESAALDGTWPWLRVGERLGPLALGEADLLAVEWRARGWTARVVELTPEQLAEHEEQEHRPRDVSGQPREYVPATVEAPELSEEAALEGLALEQQAWATGAYEAYQRQEDEELEASRRAGLPLEQWRTSALARFPRVDAELPAMVAQLRLAVR